MAAVISLRTASTRFSHGIVRAGWPVRAKGDGLAPPAYGAAGRGQIPSCGVVARSRHGSNSIGPTAVGERRSSDSADNWALTRTPDHGRNHDARRPIKHLRRRVDPRGRARSAATVAPDRGEAPGQACRAVPASRRDPCLQQPLPARGLSAGGRRARRRLRADLQLAQLEIRPQDRRHHLRRRQPAHLSGESGGWCRVAGYPRSAGRANASSGRSSISTRRWPSTTPPASRASLRASARRVPSPNWRWRAPSMARTRGCATG